MAIECFHKEFFGLGFFLSGLLCIWIEILYSLLGKDK